MAMAFLVTLAAVFVRQVLILDITHVLPTMQQEANDTTQSILGTLQLPPVIYNQTLGPIYVRDHHQYVNVWCNGTDGARITWSYNNQNVSIPAVREAVTRSEDVQFLPRGTYNNHLVIYDVNKGLHGFIQCFVTNSRGSTFGDKVFVTHAVLNKTNNFQDETKISSVVGDTITMACSQHIHDTPEANVHWEYEQDYDMDLAQKDGFFCNAQRSVCVISHVTLADAGTYRCGYTIPNKPLSLSTAFKVIVDEPLESNPNTIHPLNLIDHISSPRNVEAILGDDLNLNCAFRGTHGRYVRWTRADNELGCESPAVNALGNSLKYAFERNGTALKVANFSWDDEGFYVCIADNGYDRYAHRIHVTAVAPPVLADKVYGVEVYIGGTARLNCSVVQATPGARTVWWVNTQFVRGEGIGKYRLEDTGETLVLYNASLEDTGSIACNVSNHVGSMLGHRYVAVLNMTLPTPEETTYTDSKPKTSATTDENSTTETETVETAFQPTTHNAHAHELVTSAEATQDYQQEITPYNDVSDAANLEEKDRDVPLAPYTIDHRPNVVNLQNSGSQKPWQQHVWPWVVITMVIFLLGVLVGGLATRAYVMRRMAERDANSDFDKHSVISNNPSIREYNRQSVRASKLSRSVVEAESQSMMRGDSLILETVT